MKNMYEKLYWFLSSIATWPLVNLAYPLLCNGLLFT